MKVIYSGGRGCQKTRKYLDYYVSDELSVEGSLELTKHFANCESCSGELEARMRLKSRLQIAVSQEVVSPRLKDQVLKKIRRNNDAY